MGTGKVILKSTSVKAFYAPADSTIVVATAAGIFSVDPDGRSKRKLAVKPSHLCYRME